MPTALSNLPERADGFPSSRANLLVVDDEPMVLEVVASILEEEGYRVAQAANATEGLGMAAREPFDLAIVDYNLPHQNGLNLLGELRELQPYCQLILFSGNLNLPVVMDAVNRGQVNRLLAKPVEPRTLIDMVDEVLEHRGRLDQLRRQVGMPTLEEQRTHLHECLLGDYLQLALQPICTPERRVAAFEALIRSSHGRLDSPISILRAAEDLNQLGHVAEVVAQRAVGRLLDMPGDWKLFINAHPKELIDPALLRKRLDILYPFKERVVIEITERTYLLELSQWAQSVRMLSEEGFALAVDDLGSGYNSLVVLAELQPQYLKVDMSMTRGVDRDPRKQRLIEMLVRFGESTEALVIAEGIETEEEAHALRACGVHLFQGYLFGRPTLEADVARRQLTSVLPLVAAG